MKPCTNVINLNHFTKKLQDFPSSIAIAGACLIAGALTSQSISKIMDEKKSQEKPQTMHEK